MQAITYPSIFEGLNLDDINYYLRVGRASLSDAERLVEWWNKSGKRVTRARLTERLVNDNGVGLLAPEIRICND